MRNHNTYINTFHCVYSKDIIIYGKRWYSATKAEPPRWKKKKKKKLFSGKLLAALMQLTILGGVAWQKDDLASERGGGSWKSEFHWVRSAAFAVCKIDASAGNIRELFNSEQHRTPLHFERSVSFVSFFRQLNCLNLTLYNYIFYVYQQICTTVSSNNMGINHLDPLQQETSYQQALKYNDRCPAKPANLGLSHF